MKKNSWKYDGCKGRFFTRGIKNIIWYDYKRKPISLKLPYSSQNKIICGEKIKYLENQGFQTISDEPLRLADAIKIFTLRRLQGLESRTKMKYINMFANMFPNVSLFLTNEKEIKENIYSVLQKTTLAPVTINKQLDQLNTFSKYCKENNWISYKIYEKEMKIKQVDKLIEIWTDQELELIFNYFKKSNPKFHIFLRLLYLTSFRVMELVTLTKKQILVAPFDSKNRIYRDDILIKTNKAGNKPEFFPLADPLIKLFNKLKLPEDPDVSIFGYNLEKITHLRSVLDEVLKELEIPKHTVEKSGRGRSFHTFRKTRITDWLFKKKLSVAIVSKLSRDSIKTIMKYYAAFDSNDFKQYI